MDDPKSENPIAALRAKLDLKIDDFAEKLGCSKGHVSDLCTGRRPVTHRIALKLEALSGTPWHEWMPSNPDRHSDGEGRAA